MPLTRDFKETVRARVQTDRKFRTALRREIIEAMRSGDVDIGKAILHNFIGNHKRSAPVQKHPG